MDMTLFAKVFGPTLIAFGLFKIFFRHDLGKITKNFDGAYGAYWMESFLSMLFGLMIINATQSWHWSGWMALMPIYGWLSFGKGVLLLFLAKPLQALWGNMPNTILIGSLRLLFGLVFVCAGYFC